jgi:hypothetical protein
MIQGEDFGYLKDEERKSLPNIVKKSFILASVLFSIVCFVYITSSAYYFAYQDKDSDIRVIKSPPEPIKIAEEDDKNSVKDIDKTIYDNIVGNKNLSKENISNVKIIEQANTPSQIKSKQNSEQPSKKFAMNDNLVQTKNNKQIALEPSNSYELPSDPSSAVKKNDKNKESTIILTTESQTNQIVEKPVQNKSIKGLSRVQIAALTSKKSAVEYWSRAKKSHPTLFSRLNYFISEANLGARGTFYRLQIGNFTSQIDAEDFCRKFIAQTEKSKADCIIVE